jgi:hypothetical protein
MSALHVDDLDLVDCIERIKNRLRNKLYTRDSEKYYIQRNILPAQIGDRKKT